MSELFDAIPLAIALIGVVVLERRLHRLKQDTEVIERRIERLESQMTPLSPSLPEWAEERP